jgi:hypothetical protein
MSSSGGEEGAVVSALAEDLFVRSAVGLVLTSFVLVVSSTLG